MSNENLFLQLNNGTAASYEVATQVDLKNFQNDFLSYLSAGKQPPSALKPYEVKQNGVKLFLAIDFSKITSVAIKDDGGRPA
ncbi:hypothetical protein [Undibacterium oligocarboniphilum]|jgi:ABC-type transport system involved in cytochrome c biogenesis ATPase subunit|uniref:Uncharacterized protein n=1 Tax=Undibacterium oligocarboniphilum TaxID=666702 RepID=A0A850QN11_9BURK|nr:hypothetical protein [Undibacterium oligocarboniphilum]MBC3869395.1 hypothetical protein [Undibacterium oligocarboniphilum]NVO77774.1 hypothetical protein [Undibacterium oligocarboniphilum]